MDPPWLCGSFQQHLPLVGFCFFEAQPHDWEHNEEILLGASWQTWACWCAPASLLRQGKYSCLCVCVGIPAPVSLVGCDGQDLAFNHRFLWRFVPVRLQHQLSLHLACWEVRGNWHNFASKLIFNELNLNLINYFSHFCIFFVSLSKLKCSLWSWWA